MAKMNVQFVQIATNKYNLFAIDTEGYVYRYVEAVKGGRPAFWSRLTSFAMAYDGKETHGNAS